MAALSAMELASAWQSLGPGHKLCSPAAILWTSTQQNKIHKNSYHHYVAVGEELQGEGPSEGPDRCAAWASASGVKAGGIGPCGFIVSRRPLARGGGRGPPRVRRHANILECRGGFMPGERAALMKTKI